MTVVRVKGINIKITTRTKKKKNQNSPFHIPEEILKE